MRINFGSKPWVFPMPVLMIGTYDEFDNPNIMNAAWGGIYDYDKIEINLSEHKTTDNLKIKKAFTVSLATKSTMAESDYFGIVSAKNEPNKVKKSGFHYSKSTFVDAPIFDEYPFTIECEMIELGADGRLVGKIINISIDDSILTNGKVDLKKLQAIAYDPFNNKYVIADETIADAFKIGLKLKD